MESMRLPATKGVKAILVLPAEVRRSEKGLHLGAVTGVIGESESTVSEYKGMRSW